MLKKIFMLLALLFTLITTTTTSAHAQTMVMDPNIWNLVVNQDFTKGTNPNLYTVYCGHQGDKNGPELNNFVPGNVYYLNNQALVLKFEKKTNTSCTGVTRSYAGAGFTLNPPATSTDIAAEFVIMGTNAPGVSPYTTTWPHAGTKIKCTKGWGAEDDFFEQLGDKSAAVWDTYHYWDSRCNHQLTQFNFNIPDAATNYHAYGVIRTNGQVKFYLDGVYKGTGSLYFQKYQMDIAMGVGAYNWDKPVDSKLPAYVYIKSMKVWTKKMN